MVSTQISETNTDIVTTGSITARVWQSKITEMKTDMVTIQLSGKKTDMVTINSTTARIWLAQISETRIWLAHSYQKHDYG